MLKDRNKYIKTPLMTSFWCLIVNFEHISHLFVVFLLIWTGKYLPGIAECNLFYASLKYLKMFSRTVRFGRDTVKTIWESIAVIRRREHPLRLLNKKVSLFNMAHIVQKIIKSFLSLPIPQLKPLIVDIITFFHIYYTKRTHYTSLILSFCWLH